MKRDFTYIDDIVQGVDQDARPRRRGRLRLQRRPARPRRTSNVPYRVFNIGNNNLVELMALSRPSRTPWAKKAEELHALQDGDVLTTYANTDALNAWTGFVPRRKPVGIDFVEWYRAYYGK